MNLLQLADAATTRLGTLGVPSYDGEPTVTPLPGLYVCMYTHPGQVQRERYVTGALQVLWQVDFVCVATTEDGLRRCTQMVRDHFEGHLLDPSPAASRLTEVSAGPRLKSGPPGDRRLSQTLNYQLTTPRSLNV